jgi:hypothetical protein
VFSIYIQTTRPSVRFYAPQFAIALPSKEHVAFGFFPGEANPRNCGTNDMFNVDNNRHPEKRYP